MTRSRKHNSEAPRRSPPSWRRGLRLNAAVAAVFVLLALVGRSGVTPVKAIAEHIPHGTPFSLDAVLAAASFAIRSPPNNVPVTLVDIDDELYRQWGRPCLTPRDRLAELIAAVSARHPSVIVVDVSLGCSLSQSCCAGSPDALEGFLRAYRGATPLVLVRELHLERAGQSGQSRVLVDETPFDAAVSKNVQVSWGHTFYLTDRDGTARSWREQWEACLPAANGARTETIVSVPTRVLSLLQSGRASRVAPELPARTGDCSLERQAGQRHLLLLGQRVLYSEANRSDPGSLRRLPARLLTDARRAIDDSGYYSLTGRVAVLGASHAGSQDNWRSAVGYLSGMELVANTIRFSAVQLGHDGSYFRSLFQVVTAFLCLAAISFFLRPFLATLASAAFVIVFATVCASALGWLDVFESLEHAIWLFVGYHLVLAVMHFFGDARRYPRWRSLRAALAERIRKEDAECRSHD